MRPRRVQTGWSIGAGDAFSAALVEQTLRAAPASKSAWRNAVRAASSAAAEHLSHRAEPM
jgi:sugar/nucleoside kinase (ribokinase family)